MAAPTPVTRYTPAETMLKEGYRCLIAFANRPTVALYEKAVKPSGYMGGSAIKLTTQFNNTYHTKYPQQLIEVTDVETTVAYSPNALNDIVSYLMNEIQSVTWSYPDGSTFTAWAHMESFEPSELKVGEYPEAKCKIVIDNWDPTNNLEAGPVITLASGT